MTVPADSALGYVVAEALEDERPLSLPVSADPIVTAATDYTRAHLDRVAVRDVTHAVGFRNEHCAASSAPTWACRGEATCYVPACFVPWPYWPSRTVPSSRSQSPWVSTTSGRSPDPSPGTAGKPPPPTNDESVEHLEPPVASATATATDSACCSLATDSRTSPQVGRASIKPSTGLDNCSGPSRAARRVRSARPARSCMPCGTRSPGR
jgi:hypothetical protein